MRLNPITKQLFTDQGEFIKKMYCPFIANLETLVGANEHGMLNCPVCNHDIVDTSVYSDEEILQKVRQNADTCLKIDLNQGNVKIITNGLLESK